MSQHHDGTREGPRKLNNAHKDGSGQSIIQVLSPAYIRRSALSLCRAQLPGLMSTSITGRNTLWTDRKTT